GATESSTIEWHNAQLIPTDFRLLSRWPELLSRSLSSSRPCPPRSSLKKPLTPTTASSRSSTSVTAGSSRFTCPCFIWLTRFGGRASTSTLRPRLSAARGLKPGPTPPNCAPSIAWCSFNWSPQKVSSPKVSKRKVWRPSLNILSELLSICWSKLKTRRILEPTGFTINRNEIEKNIARVISFISRIGRDLYASIDRLFSAGFPSICFVPPWHEVRGPISGAFRRPVVVPVQNTKNPCE